MSRDDCFVADMPPGFSEGSLLQLLDRVFPVDEEERLKIAGLFDLRANPDLPEIYAVFLAVCEEWRDWRCALLVTSGDGEHVEPDCPVSRLMTPRPGSPPLLSLRLEQHYSALEYAVRHGFWESRAGLLNWLRALTALYFLDKHEARVDAAAKPAEDIGPGISGALDLLRSQGLISPQPLPDYDDGSLLYAITPKGRRFIAGLLEETESYIDQYDHFHDAAVDADGELAEFGTGRGIDLRVGAFLVEGIDPIRAVFLLRLYDGTLDPRLRDWQEAIEDDRFYDAALEPVVNRDGVGPAAMQQAIEACCAWAEEREEQARREEQQREILRQAGGGIRPR